MSNKLQIPLKSFVSFILLFAFWLIPSWVRGFTGIQLFYVPEIVSCFHAGGGLFTMANPAWPTPFVQVLLKEGGEWITLPEDEYFKMETFGYRSRLFEALFLTHHEPEVSQKVRSDLAQWVRQEYTKRKNKSPIAVRFIVGIYYVEESRTPSGKWKNMPLEHFAEENKVVLSTHNF